jgi:thiosulfate dehydrogenase
MRARPLVIAASMVLAVLGAVFVATPPAQGDPKGDQALAAAVKRGKELWTKPWSAGSKTCAECHGGGANKMSAVRLKSYPKYDKAADKVVTAQQKLNHMIQEKGKGEALELGSDDMNALEAFVATLK